MTECAFKSKHEMLESEMRSIKVEVKELDVRLRMNENKADVTASKLDTIIESIKGINNKLDELAKLPAKRWEGLMSVVISVIVTAVIMYFINSKG